MSGDPGRFLNTFAQALAAMALYRDGHPARERAVDLAYQQVQDLQTDTPRPLFTFLGDEVVFGHMPLRELKAWDWGKRLAQAGIQRLEFEDRVGREDFEGFLEEVLARLTLSAISTEARQMRRSSIRFGAVGLKGETDIGQEALPTATISFSLGEEVNTLRWLQSEVQTKGAVPLTEAEAVVRSLNRYQGPKLSDLVSRISSLVSRLSPSSRLEGKGRAGLAWGPGSAFPRPTCGHSGSRVYSTTSARSRFRSRYSRSRGS